MAGQFPKLHALILLVIMSACGSSGGGGGADPNGNVVGGGGDSTDGGGGGTGGGTLPPPSDLFIASAAERLTYDNVFLPAVAAMDTAAIVDGVPTVFSGLPTAGTMSYDGYMRLVIGGSAANANVAGPAELTLTLADYGITGAASDFMGTAVDENLQEQLVNYAGTILISNGSVIPDAGGSATVQLDIAGSLDSGLHVFGVDGTLAGYLFGTGGTGLRVLGSNTSTTGSIAATVDGEPAAFGSSMISAVLE